MNLLDQFSLECETGLYKCKVCGIYCNRKDLGSDLFKRRLCKHCGRQERYFKNK